MAPNHLKALAACLAALHRPTAGWLAPLSRNLLQASNARSRSSRSSLVAGQEVAAEEKAASDSLFESFPNIRVLPPLAPMEEWNATRISTLPPKISHGVLENGLTYFVQENPEPRARAELHLVVSFGSLVEEEDERGIAHIIEHLGFSATKSYENFAIIKFLESIGAPFGACQNAYTSFDRTVYTLHVPTDKEELVRESLTVLREFAFFTRISEDDLDKERDVVLQEWRESKNAQGRLAEAFLTALGGKGCVYCKRMPIGTEEVIRNVKAETLRKFYAKFYHPARMAVVAVGDFEGDAVLNTIKTLFNIAPQDISPLPRVPAAEAPTRPWYEVPETEGVVVASSIDPEQQMPMIAVSCKRKRWNMKTLHDFRNFIREELFHIAFANRIMKLVLDPKGARNIFQASTQSASPLPPLNPMSLSISPVPGRTRYALQDVAREIERVKRFGFYETEISRAKKVFLTGFEQDYIERDQRASSVAAEEYVALFLDGLPAPGTIEEAQIAVTVIPSITRQEISAVAGQFSFENNVVVKMATPPLLSGRNWMYTGWSMLQAFRQFRLPGSNMDILSEREVVDLLRRAQTETLDQWPEDEDDADTRVQRIFDSELQELPVTGIESGCKTSSRVVHAPGVQQSLSLTDAASKGEAENSVLGEELILKNGLRIFLKGTNLADDQIVLSAQRWGGLTGHRRDTWSGEKSGAVTMEAKRCTEAAAMIGVCGMPVESFKECMDGKRCSPGLPDMETYQTSFSSASSPADFELLLKCTNLMFRCPVDATNTSRRRLAFLRLSMLASNLAANRDPMSKFQQRVLKYVTSNHPLFRRTSLLRALGVNFEKAGQIFNEIVSAPEEWTFCLVGNLPDKETLVPLLEKYLGSIPRKGSATVITGPATNGARPSEMELRKAIIPVHMSFPEKPGREDVHLKMVDPRGRALIVYPIRLQAVTMEGDLKSCEREMRELYMVETLSDLLQTRLTEVMRFKRGQVYGVTVNNDFSLAAPLPGTVREGQLRISFECDPADTDELIDVAVGEVARFQNGSTSFSEGDVAAAVEQSKRSYEEYTRSNVFWADLIAQLYHSKTQAITEEIGASAEFWWRVRGDVLSALTASSTGDAFRILLPSGVLPAVITMRPRRSKWDAIKGLFQ